MQKTKRSLLRGYITWAKDNNHYTITVSNEEFYDLLEEEGMLYYADHPIMRFPVPFNNFSACFPGQVPDPLAIHPCLEIINGGRHIMTPEPLIFSETK